MDKSLLCNKYSFLDRVHKIEFGMNMNEYEWIEMTAINEMIKLSLII